MRCFSRKFRHASQKIMCAPLGAQMRQLENKEDVADMESKEIELVEAAL